MEAMLPLRFILLYLSMLLWFSMMCSSNKLCITNDQYGDKNPG
jgi:hypothetical protein